MSNAKASTVVRAVLVAAVLLGLVTLASCGSSGSSSSSNTVAKAANSGPSTTASKPDKAAALAAVGTCLRQHGVNIPDPTVGPNGQFQMDTSAVKNLPQSVLQPAFNACQSQLAAAQGLVRKNPDLVPQQVKFAQCMRQHGIPNFPDPDPTGAGFALKVRQQGIDTTTPAFQSAQQACQYLLPAGGA